MSEEKLAAWLEFSKDIPTTGKAAIAVVHGADGTVLAVSRENDRTDWTLPGGKLEEGEDWLTALVREVREEAKVNVISANLVHEGTSDDGHFVRSYVCRLEPEDYLRELEGTWEGDVKWARPEELVQGCFRKHNLEVFKAAGVRIDPDWDPSTGPR